jgi:PilZ domain
MAERIGWLETFLKPDSERAERRSSQRRSVENFASYRWDGTHLRQETVKDISSTGLYIVTEQRWQPGTLLFLTLQREGPMEMNPERRIEVQAKVARSGKDGVGLKFVLQEDPQSRQWDNLKHSLIEQAKPKDMLALVGIVHTVGFLSRICPGAAEPIGELLQGRLSNHKLVNAVAIALKAENLLADDPLTQRLQADPDLVVRILEDGSCTDEDWLKHYWAGLLSTCCAAGGTDETIAVCVELFSQLTTYPVRILTVVCTRATKVFGESGSISAKPLACRIEELISTTGSRGPQIERDLERLCELGLIEKTQSSSLTLLAGDETYVTPNSLALEVFARCNAHRGSLQDFYFPRTNR